VLTRRNLRIMLFIGGILTAWSQSFAQSSCDPSAIPCNFPNDNRDCLIRRCLGVDWRGCHGKWVVVENPTCVAERAAQNLLYQGQKASCEVGKSAAVTACQVAVGVSGAGTQIANVADHVAVEATEVGMRILPGEIRNGIVHLTKEASKELDKYPVVSMYLRTSLALQNPMLGKAIDKIVGRSCDTPATIAALSTSAHSAVTDFDKRSALLTTPLKQLGVSGWTPTGCAGRGEGVLTQDASRSTDGFWTVDVSLLQFTIDQLQTPAGRFIRIELDPKYPANGYAGKNLLRKGDRVLFGGPVVFDNDPPRFLEVHPIDVFVRTSEVPPKIAAALQPVANPWPRKYVIVKGDCLAWIAERNYGSQAWGAVYVANRRRIRDPNVVYPGREIILPAPRTPPSVDN